MRDLREMAAWLWTEARLLTQYIRERQLWAALACGLLLWSLAYQVPFAYQISIGGDQRTRTRNYDTPFLSAFNDSEPLSLTDTPDIRPYRWTRAHSEIVLPGVGGQQWRVLVRANSGRPDSSSIDGRFSTSEDTTTIQIDGWPVAYYLLAPTTSTGDLRLRFDAPLIPNTPDGRTLGMVLYHVTIEPTAGLYLPAPGQLALMTGALAVLYALSRRLVLGVRSALVLALAAALLGALLLVWARMALVLATPPLVWVLLGCYALALVGNALYQRALVPALGGVAGRRPLVVAVVVLALAARLVGMLHPYALSSDVGLHRHNMQDVQRGRLYFTEDLPARAGGGRAPYPPGQYLVVAPMALVLPTDDAALNLGLKVANALADSLVAGLLWYVLRRSGYSEGIAILSAALYVLPGPMLRSLSVGEFANVFGQALAMPLLVYAAVNARRIDTPRWFAGLVLLLMLALLGHLGVTISLFGLLAYLLLAWLVRPATRPAARMLVLAGMLGAGLALLFYYSALGDVLLGRLTNPSPASPDTRSLVQKLAGDFQFTTSLRVSVLLLTLGGAGAALTAFRTRRWPYPWPRPTIGALLMAWWGGTLLSFGLLLFASQGVRWQAFFYPALCLGAGPALAQLWSRGWAGRAAAIAAATLLLWNGLDFWITQIYTYLH